PENDLIINNQSLVQLNWPLVLDYSQEKLFNNYDYLICSVNKFRHRRGLVQYPDVEEIANTMIEARDFEYFIMNDKMGLATHLDLEIKEQLKKNGIRVDEISSEIICKKYPESDGVIVSIDEESGNGQIRKIGTSDQ